MFTIEKAGLAPVYLGESLLNGPLLKDLCNANHGHIVIISDDNVAKIYGNDLKQYVKQCAKKVNLISVTPGESAKTREIKADIEDKLFNLNCHRDTLLIALGGGVVCDLTGYIAATFMRGIDVLYLPTSLLAMVDAALGGKTGINTSFGKNLLGVFRQPKAILCDIASLDTLNEQQYINAYAEIIKHALVADKDYFDWLGENQGKLCARDKKSILTAVKKSIEIKLFIVSQDNTEQDLRAVLNFGHTIAHGLELISDYQIPHGKAVAIGILAESYLSTQLGLLSMAEYQKISAMLCLYPFNLKIEHSITKSQFINALRLDKKAKQQNIHFVLLESIGKAYKKDKAFTHEVEDKYLDKVLTLFTE